MVGRSQLVRRQREIQRWNDDDCDFDHDFDDDDHDDYQHDLDPEKHVDGKILNYFRRKCFMCACAFWTKILTRKISPSHTDTFDFGFFL